MFETMDVFVFTLGLTESWRSKRDGAVFPLAPGVAAGKMLSSQYEFVNFTYEQVVDDMETFLSRLAAINPRARVVLTVSPVPLIATYENRHVLVSTTYSKSVLRTAAERVAAGKAHVAYFPSYEIVTGAFTRGAYFDDDLRSIRPEGVEHVMSLFVRHYTDSSIIESELTAKDIPPTELAQIAEARKAAEVVCDEVWMDPA